MIHHLSLGTNDVDRARAFYDPVLAVLGLRCLAADKEGLGYGAGTMIFSLQRPSDGMAASVGNGVHVAFAAETRAMVDEFHRTALRHDGTDASAPDLRPRYDANYYGAFVLDLDGNKVEAVTCSAR